MNALTLTEYFGDEVPDTSVIAARKVLPKLMIIFQILKLVIFKTRQRQLKIVTVTVNFRTIASRLLLLHQLWLMNLDIILA